jgi:hypothetical protein
MQRTAQRENAFHATIRPNSNSESSTLRADTRWDDETIPRVARRGASALRCGTSAAVFAVIDGFKTLKIY